MSDKSNSLALITRASQMLMEATTIQKAKELKDIALTAAEWFKRRKMGKEAIQHALRYASLAERRVGELEIASGLNKGGRPPKTGNDTVPVSPTLPFLGLTKKESADAQFLARLPDSIFEAVASGEMTRTAARRKAKQKAAHEKVGSLSEPTGKFRVIYADPPWQYGNKGLPEYGHAESHYPTLSLGELCAMDIRSIAEDDAVLFLWATSPMLEDAFEVVRAWGFEYKTGFVWDKIKHNFGHYNSVRHEHLLVCTRGSCTPDNAKLFDSVQSIERSAKHSEKPKEFRDIIETLYSRGEKIELFARAQHPGWKCHGNQC